MICKSDKKMSDKCQAKLSALILTPVYLRVRKY